MEPTTLRAPSPLVWQALFTVALAAGLYWNHRAIETSTDALRAEVAGLRTLVAARSNPVATNTAPPADSETSSRAKKQAKEIVDNALRQKRLASADVRKLRRQFAVFDDPQYKQGLVESLQRAIGERRIEAPSDPADALP
jgi:hypothetical protein